MTISVIGSGKIVREVLQMLRDERLNIHPTSIFAHRDVTKAEELAREFDIPQVYTDYDRLLTEETADFLYVANVNTAHYEYAKRALQHGKNVVLEKPACMTYEETRTLVELAREKGLMFIEAVSLLHMPTMDRIHEHIADLGRVRLVECDYSQYSSRYDNYLRGEVAPAFSKECGGGALRDLNIYNINFVVALFGEPCEVEYKANMGFSGVDTSGILLLRYADFLCVCSAGKDCHASPYGLVLGEKGMLKVDGPVSVLKEVALMRPSTDGTKCYVETTLSECNPRHRLAYEFEHFLRMFEAHDMEAFRRYQDISLVVMKVLEKAALG